MNQRLSLLSAEEFALALEVGYQFATLAGNISVEECEGNALLQELATLNWLARITLKRFDICGDELLFFVEKTICFLDARLNEEFLALSDGAEESRSISACKAVITSIDCSYDWVEMASTGAIDGWTSLEALADIYKLCPKEDLLLLSVALSAMALAFHLHLLQERESVIVGVLFASKAIYGITNRFSGGEESISENARKAVSYRPDQILMEEWKNHCASVYQSGVEVNYLDDLLAVKGYNPLLTKQKPNTLRKWAKSAIPGLEFKSGRPPKRK